MLIGAAFLLAAMQTDFGGQAHQVASAGPPKVDKVTVVRPMVIVAKFTCTVQPFTTAIRSDAPLESVSDCHRLIVRKCPAPAVQDAPVPRATPMLLKQLWRG